MQIYPLLFNNNLKIGNIKSQNQKFLKFYRSSVAISFIIKCIENEYNLKKINIAVPYLYCQSTLNYIKQNNKNININFYDIKIGNDLDLNELNNKIKYDIIIVVNYFCESKIIRGQKIDPLKFIIEDCTHLINIDKNINNEIDFRIFSPYKFYPLPYIGICSINKNHSWIWKYYYKNKTYKIYFKKFFLYLIDDIKFLIKNILFSLHVFKRAKEINFFKNNVEVIRNKILMPSPLSLILINFFIDRNNNIYEIHNTNKKVIKNIISLINDNWYIDNKKNCYLCKINVNNNSSELIFINSLIKLGIPFMKWPDLYYEENSKKKFPDTYHEYFNNIYLPLNISNNKALIERGITTALFKYIKLFYFCEISKNFSSKGLLFFEINLSKKPFHKFKIKISFKKDSFKKIIQMRHLEFKGDKDIIQNERNLMLIKCKIFLENFVLKDLKIITGISVLDRYLI